MLLVTAVVVGVVYYCCCYCYLLLLSFIIVYNIVVACLIRPRCLMWSLLMEDQSNLTKGLEGPTSQEG